MSFYNSLRFPVLPIKNVVLTVVLCTWLLKRFTNCANHLNYNHSTHRQGIELMGCDATALWCCGGTNIISCIFSLEVIYSQVLSADSAVFWQLHANFSPAPCDTRCLYVAGASQINLPAQTGNTDN